MALPIIAAMAIKIPIFPTVLPKAEAIRSPMEVFAKAFAAASDWPLLKANSTIATVGVNHATTNAARISGFFQMALGVLIIIDIVRRSIYGSEPVSGLMMAMGAVALVANVICLVIIRKQRNEEVHMRASWIFSANDVIANLGVISAGVLVFWLDSRWPDLVIGVIVSCVVLRGAKMILEDAGNERQRALNAQS